MRKRRSVLAKGGEYFQIFINVRNMMPAFTRHINYYFALFDIQGQTILFEFKMKKVTGGPIQSTQVDAKDGFCGNMDCLRTTKGKQDISRR